MLGGEGAWAGQPELREVDDLDGGPSYPVLMGDYDTEAVWEPSPIQTGVEIGPAVPLFAKLDPSVVDEELARLGRRDAGRAGGGGPARPRAARRPGGSTATATSTSWAATSPRSSPRRRPSASTPSCRSASTSRPRSCRRSSRRSTTTSGPAVALHPNEAGRGVATDDALAEIARLAGLPQVKAVGETGLDHFRTGRTGTGCRRTRSARTSRSRRTPARRWSSTTATRTTTCCGCWRRGRAGPRRLPLLLRRRRDGARLRRRTATG